MFSAGNEMTEVHRRELEEISAEDGGESEREPFLSRCQESESVNEVRELGSCVRDASHLDDRISLLETLENRNGGEEAEIDVPTTDQQQQCRICLDVGGDDLISPCQCRGTQKFVHRSCLDHWRAAKEGFAFAHCTECRTLFNLRANVPADRRWLRLKFQLLVIRDYAIIYIVVQLVVASFSLLVYSLYGEELKEMFGYEHHPYDFRALAVIVILLVGLLYGFFIAIICGQRISKRHYHVLAKQELTKEYVVQNLSDNAAPPALEPGHLNELRSLGLY